MATSQLSRSADPLSTLRERFGLRDFRSGQRDVIDRLLAGRSVAAVFPTGGGKSLCYQLPALLLPGTTLVVSPLIALMKDQIDSLAARSIPAGRLDSSLTAEEFHECLRAVRSGETKLLFVAPERFFNERFRAAIEGLEISLFAIDEAHCISQWGHNFRPDYLKLAQQARQLRAARVLALTATATPEVLGDIRREFEIAEEDAICTPFFRPNLVLRASQRDPADRTARLAESIASRPRGATIVYVSLQRTAEHVASELADAGLPARPYHAGLDPETRAATQAWFMESDAPVVVATIAFGMGIDKSDIRYVYHFNPPKSLENYAQEIGRAGRDGADAECHLLITPDDRTVLENFVYGDTPSREAVRRLIDLVAGQPDAFFLSHYRLSSQCDIRVLVVRTLLTYLELAGYLEAVAPRYDRYDFKPRVTSRHILDHFEGERRRFLADVLVSATKRKLWFGIEVAAVARRLGCERARVVGALDYLAQRGWIELRASDLVHGYRKPKRIGDADALADELYQRLAAREASEIGRIDQVFELARAESCLAATLSGHFGQPLARPCGRCTACTGDGPLEFPASERSARVGNAALEALRRLAEAHPEALQEPRNRARLLCGMSTPGLSRARLTRDPLFGVCEQVPFAEVLRAVS